MGVGGVEVEARGVAKISVTLKSMVDGSHHILI